MNSLFQGKGLAFVRPDERQHVSCDRDDLRADAVSGDERDAVTPPGRGGGAAEARRPAPPREEVSEAARHGGGAQGSDGAHAGPQLEGRRHSPAASLSLRLFR